MRSKNERNERTNNNEIEVDSRNVYQQSNIGKTVISARNLFKQYHNNNIMAINNATFNIYRDEIVAITGKCDSGKSTLMKMLYGRIRTSYGNIFINNKKLDYWRWGIISKLISVAPKEDYVFFKGLTVSDHIKYYQSISNTRENGFTLLNELNFLGSYDDQINNLDDVEKTKVKIAIALLKFKKVIFLEEPTTGMSEKDVLCFWKVINARKTNRSIIISTLNMEEAIQNANRIIVLDKGYIRCIGDGEFIKTHDVQPKEKYDLRISVDY